MTIDPVSRFEAFAASRQWQLLVAQSPAGQQTFVASRRMPNPVGRISILSRPKQSFGAADFLMVDVGNRGGRIEVL